MYIRTRTHSHKVGAEQFHTYVSLSTVRSHVFLSCHGSASCSQRATEWKSQCCTVTEKGVIHTSTSERRSIKPHIFAPSSWLTAQQTEARIPCSGSPTFLKSHNRHRDSMHRWTLLTTSPSQLQGHSCWKHKRGRGGRDLKNCHMLERRGHDRHDPGLSFGKGWHSQKRCSDNGWGLIDGGPLEEGTH